MEHKSRIKKKEEKEKLKFKKSNGITLIALVITVVEAIMTIQDLMFQLLTVATTSPLTAILTSVSVLLYICCKNYV